MSFSRQPFEETVDTAFFFPGAARKDIVNEIRRSLANDVPLVTLTGSEGAGKSMICRVVESNLPSEIQPLLLGDGVASFDDMIRVIGDHVLVDQDSALEKRNSNALFVLADHDDHQENKDTKTLLAEIARSVRRRNQKLLIILDEAEKIYLAPLERIRRMLDSVNEGSVVIQLLLAGRPALSESLDQLSIVKFQEIEERHFVLEPLDTEETHHYLNHCIMVGTGEENSDFFSRETVAKIFSVAKGNFRKINLLGREYLKADELDTSFLNLIETQPDGDIAIEPEEERPIRSRVRAGMPNVDLDFLKLPSFRPEWLFYGGGICAIILLVALLMGQSEDETSSESVAADVPVLELTAVEPLETLGPSVLPDQPEVPAGPDLGEPQADSQPATAAEPVQTVETQTTDQPPPPQEEAVVVALPPAEIIEPPQQEAPDQDPRETRGVEDTTAETVNPIAKIVVTPLQEQKEPPPDPDVAVLESNSKKQPAPEDLRPEPAPVEVVDVETLYKQRLAAGARWLVGNNAETFTVQLMVLSSLQAEGNLKQMLHTNNYRSIADKLFILRRLGDVPTVKLFYGQFDTLVEARQARNSLPLFLRIHRPFTITISDAVANTRALQ